MTEFETAMGRFVRHGLGQRVSSLTPAFYRADDKFPDH